MYCNHAAHDRSLGSLLLLGCFRGDSVAQECVGIVSSRPMLLYARCCWGASVGRETALGKLGLCSSTIDGVGHDLVWDKEVTLHLVSNTPSSPISPISDGDFGGNGKNVMTMAQSSQYPCARQTRPPKKVRPVPRSPSRGLSSGIIVFA
jgi:hypothetical protein